MGCRKLAYRPENELLKVTHSTFKSVGKSCAGIYRYGFNGMEKDDEFTNSSSHYDFGNRIYDSRVAKFLSRDRLANKYPEQSPYVFAANMPIVAIDAQGDSVELMIGRPYTKNGEEHAYGHMALRVFNAEAGYNYVFDFGRYGSIWGFMDSEGEGILNVYTNGDAYIKSEQSMRTTVGYMKPTTQEEDKVVIDYFMAKAKEGQKYRSGAVPGGGGIAYKLVNDYHAYSNNCCTKSLDGLDQIGLNWIGDEYQPNEAFSTMEEKYLGLRLTRTTYSKGGAVSVEKPKPLPKLDLQLNLSLPPIIQDNTRVNYQINMDIEDTNTSDTNNETTK